MKWRERMVQRIHRWLQLEPNGVSSCIAPILENGSFETEVMCHRLWYRGNADELRQFYTRNRNGGNGDAGISRFWASVPTGAGIRKIHSGLPGNIVDTLAALVLSDYDGLTIDDAEHWEALEQVSNFSAVLDEAVRETLVTGDGAFKLTWDKMYSLHPSVSFVPADRVEYHTHAGMLTGISFYSNYPHMREMYQLDEY